MLLRDAARATSERLTGPQAVTEIWLVRRVQSQPDGD